MKKIERDVDEAGRRGQRAWAQLRKSGKDWGLWMQVAEALLVGRREAMALAKVNKPEGRGYNETFNQWLARYKLGDIDKAVRANLLYIAEHRSEFEEYRAQLPLSERLRMNHP